MALIEVKAHPELLEALIRVLHRIADGIDRAYPIGPNPEARKKMTPYGPETLIEFDPEAEWLREEEERIRLSKE